MSIPHALRLHNRLRCWINTSCAHLPACLCHFYIPPETAGHAAVPPSGMLQPIQILFFQHASLFSLRRPTSIIPSEENGISYHTGV